MGQPRGTPRTAQLAAGSNQGGSCGGGATLWQPGDSTMGSKSGCGETCWQPGQCLQGQEPSSSVRSELICRHEP